MKNLFKSLAEFQQEVPVIHKATQGYGYTFADLPKIFSVINPLLKKHGLGFTQLIENENLTTILFHVESGETIESKMALLKDVSLKGMNEFQVYGSQLTYFRRYALSSILGIVTDKDTDAGGEQVKKVKTITDERFNKAIDAIGKGLAKKEDLLQFELTESQKLTFATL
jgi:hypothetical protein